MPGFVLPESEVLIDLNLDFGFDISRSGDSQTMTPLGSWHSISSQSVGGLVLPSSSPHAPAEFQLHDGDGPNELEQPTGMLGGDDVLDLPEPEFTFDEDGDIIDLPVHSSAARTPGVYPGSAMQSDAGASEKVRRDHQEGLQAARQVSDAAIFLLVYAYCFQVTFPTQLLSHLYLAVWHSGTWGLPQLKQVHLDPDLSIVLRVFEL